MDTSNQVQILGEALSISHNTNTIRKGMNQTILSPAMDK